MARTRNVAVILAGGVGDRVGLGVPKQLVKIAGRPIMEHTLAIVEEHPKLDEVVVMMAAGYLDHARDIVRKNHFEKVTHILEGAGSRNETTKLALDAIAAHCGEDCNVILHDAVRPLLSPRIIGDVVTALESYSAVDVAIPSADTIIEVDDRDGNYPTIKDVPLRAKLRRGQTPQAFKLSTLRRAYGLASMDPDFVATDDCTVVLRYTPEVPIAVVTGDDRNMKVTEPIDIFIADKLFQLPQQGDSGATDEVYKNALAGKTMAVFGGSSGIGSDIARLAKQYGATVKSFSRSSTNTHMNNRDDLIAARDAITTQTGRVDFVVNTAGVLPRGRLNETTDETIQSATQTNYVGPMLLAQTFYNALAETSGSLLFFTSSSYTRGRSGYSLYSSAKAAIVNLTQALADEWTSDNIRVNCINPERTRTPMRSNAFGIEDPNTLLDSQTVALAALNVLIAKKTGHIIDVRRDDPFAHYRNPLE